MMVLHNLLSVCDNRCLLDRDAVNGWWHQRLSVIVILQVRNLMNARSSRRSELLRRVIGGSNIAFVVIARGTIDSVAISPQDGLIDV